MKARFQLTAEDIKRAVAEYIGAVRKVNVTPADVHLTADGPGIRASVDLQDRH